MRSKKLVKIILLLIVLGFIFVLIKNNVTAVRENPVDNKGNSTLTLDVNSEIVQKLYKDLNLNLINNSCKFEDGCLASQNYHYLYFKDENSKELTNDEKLYLIINSIYNDRNFTEITQENDELKFQIDLDIAKDKLKSMYNIDVFESFQSTLRTTNRCGIVDFLYTGNYYEVTIDKCYENDTFGHSKLISAIKEENYIYLNIQSFYVEFKKEKYSIYNFLEEDTLVKKINDVSNLDFVFDEYDVSTFTFRFELIGDSYFLKDITKERA